MNLIKEITLEASGNELIDRLKDFVLDCNYLCHKQTIEKVQTYIHCDCDIKRTVEELGGTVDEDGIRSSVWYANLRLKEIFSAGILDKVYDDPSLADELISWAEEHPDEIIISQVMEHIPSWNHKRYNWEECIPEIKFFRAYSYPTIKKRAEALDKRKLAYILHVLEEPDARDIELSLALKKNLTYS